MEKAGLNDSTETLLIAAKEQGPNIRFTEAGIYHISRNLDVDCTKMLQSNTWWQDVFPKCI